MSKKKIIGIFIIALLLIIVFFIISWPVENLDYCAKTKTTMSPQQRIDRVIDEVLTHQEDYANNSIQMYKDGYFSRLKRGEEFLPDKTDIPLGKYQLVPYIRKEEFIKDNPQCCQLVKMIPEGATIADFYSESYYGERFVHLVYFIKYIDERGKEHKFLVDNYYFAVSNCGDKFQIASLASCLYYKRMSKYSKFKCIY